MRWSPLPDSWMEAAERNQSRCKSFPAVQMSGIPQTPTQASAPPAFPDTSLMAVQAGHQQEGWTKIMRENSQPLQMRMEQTVGLKCAEDMANSEKEEAGGEEESLPLRESDCVKAVAAHFRWKVLLQTSLHQGTGYRNLGPVSTGQ